MYTYRFTSPSVLVSTGIMVALFLIVFRLAKKQDIAEANERVATETKQEKEEEKKK